MRERLNLYSLIGVDRVTDAASMSDFHRCDLQSIWEHELEGSFGKWIRIALDDGVGYEEETIRHFDSVLQPLVERGLADVLQISSLLQELDLSIAQDGRDAEKGASIQSRQVWTSRARLLQVFDS